MIGPYRVGWDIPAMFEDPEVSYPAADDIEVEELSAWDPLPVLGDMLVWDGYWPYGEEEEPDGDVDLVEGVKGALMGRG
ncbi:hypothetical protein HK104_006330 [Borealophlyctis nickersoniae]|nr:hypothetical protein HK104_006330 [Borealophlyctis nickersoniae]